MSRWQHIRDLLLKRRVLRHAGEIVLLVSVYMVYMFVRKYLIPNIEPVSFANAFKVLSFESAGSFLWEPRWQAWVIENSKALAIFSNWVYIITFWPIICVTGLILYIKDRRKYLYFRNIFLLTYLFALLIFALFPLAPPRFLPEYGFVDTIQRFGPSWYGGREMAAYYNAFAAMPSLHFAWTIFFGVLFFTIKNIWVKLFGIIYPAMTFFAITLTGNHYIIDALGGAAVIVGTFLVYIVLARLRIRSRIRLASVKPYASRVASPLHYILLRGKVRATRALTSMKPNLGLDLVGRWQKKWLGDQLASLKIKRTQGRGAML